MRETLLALLVVVLLFAPAPGIGQHRIADTNNEVELATLPGNPWKALPEDRGLAHRALPGFVGAAIAQDENVVAFVFVRPWDQVPTRPSNTAEMTTYIDDVVAELATREDTVVLDSTVTTIGDDVVGRFEVMRSGLALNDDLGFDGRYAVRQVTWSVPSREGLVQLFAYFPDDDRVSAMESHFFADNNVRFVVSGPRPAATGETRSWWVVLTIFIGLLAMALLGLRLYQRANRQQRHDEFAVDAGGARPTPRTAWEDELDAMIPEDEAASDESS